MTTYEAADHVPENDYYEQLELTSPEAIENFNEFLEKQGLNSNLEELFINSNSGLPFEEFLEDLRARYNYYKMAPGAPQPVYKEPNKDVAARAKRRAEDKTSWLARTPKNKQSTQAPDELAQPVQAPTSESDQLPENLALTNEESVKLKYINGIETKDPRNIEALKEFPKIWQNGATRFALATKRNGESFAYVYLEDKNGKIVTLPASYLPKVLSGENIEVKAGKKTYTAIKLGGDTGVIISPNMSTEALQDAVRSLEIDGVQHPDIEVGITSL